MSSSICRPGRLPGTATPVPPDAHRMASAGNVAGNPGKLISQQTLLAEVWGPQHTRDTGYLRLYMGQLRKKLESGPGRAALLPDRVRHGYRYVPIRPRPTTPDGPARARQRLPWRIERRCGSHGFTWNTRSPSRHRPFRCRTVSCETPARTLPGLSGPHCHLLPTPLLRLLP
jgi:hypothetical protein